MANHGAAMASSNPQGLSLLFILACREELWKCPTVIRGVAFVVNILLTHQFSSVVQLCLTLWPHGLQHTRLPCPPTPKPYSNPCACSRWCHPNISSSVVPFSSRLQSFPASLEEGMTNHFSILAWRTPWTVWKGKKDCSSIAQPNNYIHLFTCRFFAKNLKQATFDYWGAY